MSRVPLSVFSSSSSSFFFLVLFLPRSFSFRSFSCPFLLLPLIPIPIHREDQSANVVIVWAVAATGGRLPGQIGEGKRRERKERNWGLAPRCSWRWEGWRRILGMRNTAGGGGVDFGGLSFDDIEPGSRARVRLGTDSRAWWMWKLDECGF